MYNLWLKDFKLGVNPLYFAMPVLTGALMLVPGWIYFLVLLYFCWITIPNMFGGFRTHNDLMLSSMMPVTKRDMVKSRVLVIVCLEVLHIGFAVIFGVINRYLYPDFIYYFYAPTIGFLGLCLVMLAIFNLLFLPLYYKTAYKYGNPAIVSITAAMLFAGGAQWLGIANADVSAVINDIGTGHLAEQSLILVSGVAIFAVFTAVAYRLSVRHFLKVEL
ncbi:ABC-2 transporter permease [Cohnella hashimotonis]|uniref:ABC-2 transporter permease n=1 Tax=Cohnella hashimotonis TaxID=2826895 RepID=A0ABT6TEJ0_9BACL|nr:ABC-2 transporter permease [Cohnella hashimotonis]MDI4645221.1 ABC-2 transporter permease [Cohnella hashimotonis]